MTLQFGTRLGPYEIQSAIGAGGMGEVYRATDTNLKRSVAIKVLPESVAADRERLARFQREAEVLASLNHPNIAAIYGLERSDTATALVMELVEGPTLAERIAQGPIPIDETLSIAKQIAEALEAAHEQSIIHRDLKPANIKLRPDGVVKVLDFGLAKALGPSALDDVRAREGGHYVQDGRGVRLQPDLTASPTITSPAMMTGVGVILGTAAYMSPEQARGKAVDRRTDIWALGCVVYEMLTGQRPFDGEDVAVTLARVVEREPNWSALPPTTPASIQRLLLRCLEKRREKRLDSAAAVRLEIDDARAADLLSTHTRSPQGRRVVFVGVGVFVLGAVVASTIAWMVRPVPVAQHVSRLVIPLAEGEALAATNAGSSIALSPDGTTVVYAAFRGSIRQLFRRDLSTLVAQPIVGTEDGNFPVFSPDGQSLAFVRGIELLSMSLAGGAATRLYRGSNNEFPTQPSWGPSGIVFGLTGNGDGLMHVSPSGGPATQLTTLDEVADETDHRQPAVLPNGEALLFTVWSGATVNEGLETAEIAAYIPSTGERRTIIPGAAPQFVDPGHLIFVRPDGVWAAPFSTSRLEITGAPVRVLEGVMTFRTGLPQLAVSANGTLAYQPGSSGFIDDLRTVTWVTRSGTEESVGVPPRAYVYARLSPDGTRIALDARDEQNDIWIWSTQRRTLMRLTFDPGQNIGPVWTPDGTRVAFGAEPSDGGPGLFWTRADGAGDAERLVSQPVLPMPTGFAPDGGRLVFHAIVNPRNISVVAMSAKRNADLLLQTSFDEANAELSPDGKWLAYQSNESGRYEIYVRPFPDVTAGRWQISSSGGDQPMWARDGRALFYVTRPLLTLMEVPIEPGVAFVAGTPQVVVRGPNAYLAPQYGRPYDVTRDGQKFLMLKDAAAPTTAGASAQQIIVVQNWFEDLKRLAPVN